MAINLRSVDADLRQGVIYNKTFPLIAELPTVQLDHIERKDQWVGPKAQICLLREGGKKENTGNGKAAFIDVFFLCQDR